MDTRVNLILFGLSENYYASSVPQNVVILVMVFDLILFLGGSLKVS